MSPHQALGSSKDTKGAKDHLNPPASPLALGGGRQEMPRDEQQDKIIQERICFTTALVGEESTGRYRGGETVAPGGKALARG